MAHLRFANRLTSGARRNSGRSRVRDGNRESRGCRTQRAHERARRIAGLTLNSIPLRFYWFDDGLHVVKVDPAYVDLLGAKVLRIGGLTPDELMHASVSYVGGSASLAHELAIYAMESPQTLHAMGLIRSSSSVVLTLETLDGQRIERTIMALSMSANGPPENSARSSTFDRRELRWPRRELSPVPLPDHSRLPATDRGRP